MGLEVTRGLAVDPERLSGAPPFQTSNLTSPPRSYSRKGPARIWEMESSLAVPLPLRGASPQERVRQDLISCGLVCGGRCPLQGALGSVLPQPRTGLLPATASSEDPRRPDWQVHSPGSAAGHRHITPSPAPRPGSVPALLQTHLPGRSEAHSRGVTEVPASSFRRGLPARPQPKAPASRLSRLLPPFLSCSWEFSALFFF